MFEKKNNPFFPIKKDRGRLEKGQQYHCVS